MRRLAKPLVLLAALLFAGCGKSNCERLGERLCSCTGLSSDQCTSQVTSELGGVPQSQSQCGELLGSCTQPPGVNFCEWLNTVEGKQGCGLAPTFVPTTAQ
jgi:hypothetical protein